MSEKRDPVKPDTPLVENASAPADLSPRDGHHSIEGHSSSA
jgi:hypothetical protein